MLNIMVNVYLLTLFVKQLQTYVMKYRKCLTSRMACFILHFELM